MKRRFTPYSRSQLRHQNAARPYIHHHSYFDLNFNPNHSQRCITRQDFSNVWTESARNHTFVRNYSHVRNNCNSACRLGLVLRNDASLPHSRFTYTTSSSSSTTNKPADDLITDIDPSSKKIQLCVLQRL